MFAKKTFVSLAALLVVAAVTFIFQACAGERQGLVCSEIQYRLDTQTYSPDQRAYIENELNECRAEEARKRGEDAQIRQGIYERYAASGIADTTSADSSSGDISVSKALEDSSAAATVSIYERYKAVDTTGTSAPGADAAEPADTSAAEAGSFQ
ncbi:MAG: hypothetical protein IK012_05885 [Fibrobacter sp.]|uniref:hypothetical protein n=1 Tax=Fibrobacter sp. TaxID=35828 RepID=UPI0025B9A230|nr:hypothetical protein [Fibrobacter sp.]MBR4784769.1 hypothetical protein [Fibrobacter sp.]